MALTKITGEGVGAVDDLTVDTSTLHVDAANNRVGIGTVSPSVPLSISSADNIVASFESTDAVQWIAMQDSDTSSSTHVMLGAIGDDLRFRAGNNEVGRWLSGGGLAFNGDTAQANALDDYEEGTWTPVPSSLYGFSQGGSASYSGNYVKIGDLVYVNCSLDFDTSETLALGDRFIIQNLPFTMTGGKNGVGGGSFIQPGSFASGTHVVGTVASNSQSQDEIMCVVTRVNGTPPALNNTNVNCGITYRLTNAFS